MNRPAFDIERKSGESPLSYRRGRRPRVQDDVRDEGVVDDVGDFGATQSTAEAELYAYLNRVRQGRRSGFAPIEELTSRLGEFSSERASSNVSPSWEFATRESSAQRPVMTGDETARLARAASEIFLVAQSMEKTRLDLHALAVSTREDIVTTVKSTALEAAAVAVKRVETAAKQAFTNNFTQLDATLRALQTQTAEAHTLTNQALSKMDVTLDRVLKQTAATFHPAEINKARPQRQSLQTPINAVSETFSAPKKRNATSSATQASLAAMIERARLQASAVNGSSSPSSGDGKADDGPPAFLRALQADIRQTADSHVPPEQPPRDEGVGFPIIGIAIVAVVMLLASAALYILHAQHATPAEPMTRAAATRALSHPKAPLPALQALTEEPFQTRQAPAFQAVAPGIDSPNIEDTRRVFAAAQNGDADAQYQTGMRLLANADQAAGARWLRRAADQDHAQALFALAWLFEHGSGVARDDREAVALYRSAAERGHTRAMHNLAVLLHQGLDPHADVEAAKWFALAASSGAAASQYNLALFYERGLGVPVDLSKAYFWFSVAAEQGDEDARLQAQRVSKSISPSAKASVIESVKLWRPSTVIQ